MKRTPLMVMTACVVGISPLTPSQAKQQCWVEPPPEPQSHWSYRIIDDRKCWYEGKPMLSRSLLEWPAQTPAAAVPEQALASMPKDETNGFEARWRDRFVNAMGKY